MPFKLFRICKFFRVRGLCSIDMKPKRWQYGRKIIVNISRIELIPFDKYSNHEDPYAIINVGNEKNIWLSVILRNKEIHTTPPNPN